jgi:hypothetical protein
MPGEEKKEEVKTVEEKVEAKKEELREGVAKESPTPEAKKMREIVLQFDSSHISIVKAEVASNFEFQAILENVLKLISEKK